MAIDWKKELNERQYEAVVHEGGPLLVLAGAGSGKTRAVTYRIAHLILEVGVRPESILAVTFTNKAAGEMRDRVERLLVKSCRGLWIHTFHAFCARVLRREIEVLGYPGNFVIYDERDRLRLVKECRERIGVDGSVFNPGRAVSRISYWKGRGWGPEEAEANVSSFRGGQEWLTRLYREYQRKLLDYGALDFDDLLLLALRLFKEHEEARRRYAERFEEVLVDEYQDTSRLQDLLIGELAREKRRLTVVGDDDQSIYRWRGAEVRNILDFPRAWSPVTVVKMERNYRSTMNILRAASSVIQKNAARTDKTIYSELGDGAPVEVLGADDDRAEAARCISRLERATSGGGRNLGEAAVLYRVHARSRVLEEALISRGIPYVLVGGVRFYERAEVKDVLAYLKVAENPRDAVSAGRAMGTPPRGVGRTTLRRIEERAEGEGCSFLEAAKNLLDEGVVKGRGKGGLRSFLGLVETLRAQSESEPPSRLIETVLRETDFEAHLLRDGEEEGRSRVENVEELSRAAAEYERRSGEPSLSEFLEEAALFSEADRVGEGRARLNLMTLHCAKGLEYPIVFIVGLEEGTFPHSRSIEGDEVGPEELEEERRLFYVGLTRAKERLFLSYSLTRSLYGENKPARPSRFLAELPKKGVEWAAPPQPSRRQSQGPAPRRWAASGDKWPPPPKKTAPRRATSSSGTFPAGSRVVHDLFGLGIVRETSQTARGELVVVDFTGHGEKTLMLRFANLRRG